MVDTPPLDSDYLKKIRWSEESLTLSNFVSRYPLPQIVQVEEGFDGGSDENSLSAGQVLKIHTLTTERKVLSLDCHEKEVHIPLHTDRKVVLRPSNYDTVYQKVADLSRAKPLPPFVEVTRGYYNVDSNVDYELSVEPGDKLELISDSTSLNLIRLQKKKIMTFRTMDGIEVKLPFDCVAGFKPLLDTKEHFLADVIPNETNNRAYPFYFDLLTENESHRKLGVLKCISSYDDRLIIASSGHGSVQVVFMIPYNLEVTVKVAVGTLQNDPAYENIRSSFHNFEAIENDVQNSRVSQIFQTSGELSGFTYTPGELNHVRSTRWETFDDRKENLSSEEIFRKESQDRRLSCELLRQDSRENGAAANKRSHSVDVANNRSNSVDVANNRSNSVDVESDNIKLLEKQPVGTTDSLSSNENRVNYNNIPNPVNTVIGMSVYEICESLRSLNMEKYVEMFEENQIDGQLLSTLDFQDFQEFGLKRLEIKKIFSFRDGWRPKMK